MHSALNLAPNPFTHLPSSRVSKFASVSLSAKPKCTRVRFSFWTFSAVKTSNCAGRTKYKRTMQRLIYGKPQGTEPVYKRKPLGCLPLHTATEPKSLWKNASGRNAQSFILAGNLTIPFHQNSHLVWWKPTWSVHSATAVDLVSNYASVLSDWPPWSCMAARDLLHFPPRCPKDNCVYSKFFRHEFTNSSILIAKYIYADSCETTSLLDMHHVWPCGWKRRTV